MSATFLRHVAGFGEQISTETQKSAGLEYDNGQAKGENRVERYREHRPAPG